MAMKFVLGAKGCDKPVHCWFDGYGGTESDVHLHDLVRHVDLIHLAAVWLKCRREVKLHAFIERLIRKSPTLIIHFVGSNHLRGVRPFSWMPRVCAKKLIADCSFYNAFSRDCFFDIKFPELEEVHVDSFPLQVMFCASIELLLRWSIFLLGKTRRFKLISVCFELRLERMEFWTILGIHKIGIHKIRIHKISQHWDVIPKAKVILINTANTRLEHITNLDAVANVVQCFGCQFFHLDKWEVAVTALHFFKFKSLSSLKIRMHLEEVVCSDTSRADLNFYADEWFGLEFGADDPFETECKVEIDLRYHGLKLRSDFIKSVSAWWNRMVFSKTGRLHSP